MSVRKWLVTATIFTAALAAAPRTASADWTITPFVGWNFSGSADVSGTGGSSLENQFEKKIDYGVSLTGMGAGVVGFELDFGYSPNFFETGTASNNNFAFTNDSNVITLTGNAIVGIPVGGHGPSIRPYVVGGVGLIRSQIDGGTIARVSSSTNMFGWDAGAGVMGYFSDHVGLRGDVRYLRAVSDLTTNVTSIDINGDKLHFWRATIGVTFR